MQIMIWLPQNEEWYWCIGTTDKCSQNRCRHFMGRVIMWGMESRCPRIVEITLKLGKCLWADHDHPFRSVRIWLFINSDYFFGLFSSESWRKIFAKNWRNSPLPQVPLKIMNLLSSIISYDWWMLAEYTMRSTDFIVLLIEPDLFKCPIESFPENRRRKMISMK